MNKYFLLLSAVLLEVAGFAQIGIGTTVPHSTLDIRGSISTNYRTFTANATANATDNVLVFAGSAATILTLPTALGIPGRSYQIKNASSTDPTPTLTIETTSSQTIDGLTSWTVNALYETITIVSNGTNWHMLSYLPSSINSIQTPGMGGQSIDATLAFARVTDDYIDFTNALDVSGAQTYKYTPSNAGIVYSGHGSGQSFYSGWGRFDGVNSSGRPNVVATMFGYNVNPGGSRVNTDEAAFRFGTETHFETGGQELFEFHLPEVTSYDGSIRRPFSMYIDKTLGGAAINWLATTSTTYENLAGQALFGFDAGGNYYMQGRGDGTTLELQRNDAFSEKLQIQITTPAVYFNTYGIPQYHDSKVLLNGHQAGVYLDIIDNYPGANNSTISIQANSAANKNVFNAYGAVTGIMSTTIDNSDAAGSSALRLINSAASGTGLRIEWVNADYRTYFRRNNDGFNFLSIGYNGDVVIPSLAGVSNRMVVASSSGALSTQPITGDINFSTKVNPSGTADPQGNEGDMRISDDFIYVKTSTGWKRAALSTF